MFRPVALVSMMLLAATSFSLAAPAPECRELLSEEVCDALPDPSAVGCEDVLAPPVCALAPSGVPGCADVLAAGHCETTPSPLGLADPALCDTAQLTIEGGCVLWELVFGDASTYFMGSAVSPDGATSYHGGYAGDDAIVVAADVATGDLLWSTVWDGGIGSDRVWAVAVSVDGARVYAVGSAYASGSMDALFLALDAEDGSVLSTTTRDGGAGRHDAFRQVAVSSDGSTVAVGGTFGRYYNGDHNDLVIATFDTTANALNGLWTYGSPPDNRESASAIAVSEDGARVAIVGSTIKRSSTFGPTGGMAFVVERSTFFTRATYFGTSTSDAATDVYFADAGGSLIVVRGSLQGPLVHKLSWPLLGIEWTSGEGAYSHATHAELAPDGSAVVVATTEPDGNGSASIRVQAISTEHGGTLWTTSIGPAGMTDMQIASTGTHAVLLGAHAMQGEPTNAVFVVGLANGDARAIGIPQDVTFDRVVVGANGLGPVAAVSGFTYAGGSIAHVTGVELGALLALGS